MSGLWQWLRCHTAQGYSSCGSCACFLPRPPCCEAYYCPGAGSCGTEPSWPTCFCPYPISQLWQLWVWKDKVCVCVSLCILRKLQKTVADGKACRCIEACTLSFWGKIQGEFIYFEICWGFHLLLDQVYSAATPQCYKWQSLKDVNDGSKTAILLFKGNFFKCETSGLVHFTKGMSSINKLIWKRLEETTLPFSLPLHDIDCISFDRPVLSALLSFQYLSFQRSSNSNNKTL